MISSALGIDDDILGGGQIDRLFNFSVERTPGRWR